MTSDFMRAYTDFKFLDHIDAIAMYISSRWTSTALVHTTFRMDYNFHSDLLQQLLWIRIAYNCIHLHLETYGVSTSLLWASTCLQRDGHRFARPLDHLADLALGIFQTPGLTLGRIIT